MTDMSAAAKEVFQVLLEFNYTVKMYDDTGMDVVEPSEARRMFASSPNLMVILNDADDDSSVTLMFGKSTHAADIDGLMQTLRTTATKYNMTFNPKQHGAEIDAKNYQNLISVSEAYKDNSNMHVCEGMYGTSRSSYLQLDNARMIIQHQGRIANRPDARGRRIGAIFIENAAGNRFRFPSVDLAAARAFTEHVNKGGTFKDQTARKILEAGAVEDTFLDRLASMSVSALKAEVAKLQHAVDDGIDTFYSSRRLAQAKDALKKKDVNASTLAENNRVVREFMSWTERFEPDRALMEFNDPYDPYEGQHERATDKAIDDFDPQEFLVSDQGQDFLMDYDDHEDPIPKAAVMSALNHYLTKSIEGQPDGDFGYGFNSDETGADAVYHQVVKALENAGYEIEDDSTLGNEGEIDDPFGEEEDVFANQDELGGVGGDLDDPFGDSHFGPDDDAVLDEMGDGLLTREDVLLPDPNQGVSLGREVSKAVVHDDPLHPDEVHEPHQSYIQRLRSLSGMRTSDERKY
jgi:hypothetical protein